MENFASTQSLVDASLILAMLVAALAGLLSFLSPCVLPVSAPYLAYMGGVSVNEMDEDTGARRRVMVAAVAFVLGLSTVFLFLGYAMSMVGQFYFEISDKANIFFGLMIMLFGAHFVGAIRIPLFMREARVDVKDQGGSILGAYLLGLAFAFGWTPCLGPILSAILAVAANESSATRGAILLFAYAMGLGIPFLLVAAFFSRLKGPMAWMRRHMDRIERISGLLLWTVGLMLLTGRFTDLSRWLLEAFPVLANIG
ncbi:cytochrome c biogenesis protein CcdA [Marivivens donghaensis]|uniref:Cytochrome c biogenesis protein CcdA n=1 Tax=Marivivens donghaensis TaxID=1699413 RepID=A0ABX0W1I6_9RHOB|nr:cytochrome c biogenesis protein CcdA [Marivivens donghaensis]NIY72792.1 cytochrome c biogenesis protein CcdA [Marivivens donghaensis]